MKEELQDLDLQHKLILKQLQVLQQQQKQKQRQLHFRKQVRPQQLIFLQQPQTLPPRLPPSMPPQSHPGVLQMPPNMHPQMSPMSFPQAVLIPGPILQPQKTHSASIQHIPPSTLNASPVSPRSTHAPPTPHRLNVPPASMVPMIQNVTTASTPSICQQAVPLTQNLKVAQASSPNQAVSVGSTLVNQHAVPSTFSNPATCPSQPCPSPSPPCSTMNLGRGQKEANNQEAVCSSQKEVDFGGEGNGVDGACTGVEGAGESVIKEVRRIREPSQTIRALQGATKAKVTAFFMKSCHEMIDGHIWGGF